MKTYFFKYKLLLIFKIYNIITNELNGIYNIKSFATNLYFSFKNNKLILSNNKSQFRISLISSNLYLINSRFKNKRIGVDGKNNIKIYNNMDYKNNINIYWKIIKINDNSFIIQNEFNQNFLEVKNNQLYCCSKSFLFIKNNIGNISIKNDAFKFILIKLFQERTNKNLKIIKNESIDVIIKYIDLTDKNLRREGITQIYKDKDNEELRYSIRSILQYIPWIRKIYILMPNERVKFLKSVEEINEKIVYIKDKDFLGYESANIHSFTFNLYKLEKFGISKNFIYMEDDFFIGKKLKKNDFFYYDENEKKIVPYILSFYFHESNYTKIINDYNNYLQIKDSIHPHSDQGWKFSILNTEKYFLEKYKFPIINPRFTHNAISENIDDLKEVFEEIKEYKYINETLFSKERDIFTLNQPKFLYLYLLNVKKRAVYSIPYNYIPIESINKYDLNINLFVLNTGGNHKPLKRQYNFQKKIMEKRFPFQIYFELHKISNKFFIYAIKFFFNIFKII